MTFLALEVCVNGEAERVNFFFHQHSWFLVELKKPEYTLGKPKLEQNFKKRLFFFFFFGWFLGLQ